MNCSRWATTINAPREINKERVDLEPIVTKRANTVKPEKAWMKPGPSSNSDNDAELAGLAELDIADLSPKIEALEKEIKGMLVPKDPRDDRNVIVEIRAGAGGDEAAIFASDLFRMYMRFAEEKRWKTGDPV